MKYNDYIENLPNSTIKKLNDEYLKTKVSELSINNLSSYESNNLFYKIIDLIKPIKFYLQKFKNLNFLNEIIILENKILKNFEYNNLNNLRIKNNRELNFYIYNLLINLIDLSLNSVEYLLNLKNIIISLKEFI